MHILAQHLYIPRRFALGRECHLLTITDIPIALKQKEHHQHCARQLYRVNHLGTSPIS